MPVTLKNWKLNLVALLFICLFSALGCWQVSRAHQKQRLLQSFSARTQQKSFHAADLNQPKDWRFYTAQLEGYFDNDHTLLLDNKIFHGKVGYEVYTPFKVVGLNQSILVDRGFVPMGNGRRILPSITPIRGKTKIKGMLNVPPAYFAFGQMQEHTGREWPLRIEYIQMTALSPLIGYPLFSYLLHLAPKEPAAYAIEWQIVTMGPEKHMGYAIQWFALALTLLILSVALNRGNDRHSR